MIFYIRNNFEFRVINKVSSIFKKNINFINKYGLKSTRAVLQNRKHPALLFQTHNIIYLNPQILTMGFDSLKDKYTHVGKNITESPHYELIDCCAKNDLENSIYVEFEKEGCLDGRTGFVLPDFYEYHMKIYEQAKKRMETNTTTPIRVYLVDGSYYLFDGKHRAALYAYFKKESIPAIVVPTSLVVNKKFIIFKLGKNFSKNKELAKKAINCKEFRQEIISK